MFNHGESPYSEGIDTSPLFDGSLMTLTPTGWLDLALLVPSWSERAEWAGRTHLYVHQRPRGSAPGSRVWLCQGRVLFHSYRLDGFLELARHLPPGAAGSDQGWALQVSDGRPEDLALSDVPDEAGVAARWAQGYRYLSPGATAFVKAPPSRRSRRAEGTVATPDRAAALTSSREVPPVPEVRSVAQLAGPAIAPARTRLRWRRRHAIQ